MLSHISKRVAKEIRNLVQEPIEGIKLDTQDEVLTTLHAEIKGPEGTPYEGGSFKVRLELGSNFPQQPPKGYFTTPIFHPNVGPSGEICVNTLKRDWSADNTMKHILIVIRCLLIHPNPDSALNEEAGRLVNESYDAFFARAKLFTSVHAKTASAVFSQRENVDPAKSTRPKAPLRKKKKTRGKKNKTLRRL
jgi:ubiquitin-protein ligase